MALTLGARYNYEKRTGTGSFIFDAIGVNVPTDKSKSWDKVTPKVLFEYTNSYEGLAYAKYTQGFKSGVINIGSLNDVIDPEYVDAYEIGYKMPFADGRASLRAAAFYYDYTDLQVGFVNEQSVVQTVNAASAENMGVEVEIAARLTEGLSANFSATWLDATYTDFVTGDYRNNFEQVNLKGNYLQNAPKYTLYGALNYTRPVTDDGSFIGRIEASYQDKVYFTEFNNCGRRAGCLRPAQPAGRLRGRRRQVERHRLGPQRDRRVHLQQQHHHGAAVRQRPRGFAAAAAHLRPDARRQLLTADADRPRCCASATCGSITSRSGRVTSCHPRRSSWAMTKRRSAASPPG